MACEALTRQAVAGGRVEAATTVAAGAFVPPSIPPHAPDLAQRAAALPAFCRVQAIATPTPDSRIGIEVWLPLAGWNGRLLGTGNGGGAGAIAYGMGMVEGLRRGFAVANTDMGTAPDINGTADHPERWVDFGHRATHEMTRVAKRMVTSFYGNASFRSYFAGCSTGGQQGLSAAQRYPEDYDGVLAGAPGNNRTHVAASFLWNYAALNASPASRLSAANWAMVNQAVLGACAGRDGGAPGDAFLTDPRRCDFDPATLPACANGVAGDRCLTPPQAEAVRRLYAGPSNPRTGERIFAPLTPGSETQPLGPVEQGDAAIFPPQQFYPFRWALGVGFDPTRFDFDRDMERVDARLAATLNANSADLSAFRQRGGRLMIYTGTADPAVPTDEVVHYYQRLMDAAGGLEAARGFARLFLVPGMGHCFGGPGITDFGQPFSPTVFTDPARDALAALVAWTEGGAAPDGILASRPASQDGRSPAAQRPICPYPGLPRFMGGDPTTPGAFACMNHPRGARSVPATRYLD